MKQRTGSWEKVNIKLRKERTQTKGNRFSTNRSEFWWNHSSLDVVNEIGEEWTCRKWLLLVIWCRSADWIVDTYTFPNKICVRSGIFCEIARVTDMVSRRLGNRKKSGVRRHQNQTALLLFWSIAPFGCSSSGFLFFLLLSHSRVHSNVWFN